MDLRTVTGSWKMSLQHLGMDHSGSREHAEGHVGVTVGGPGMGRGKESGLMMTVSALLVCLFSLITSTPFRDLDL